jgi:hypothetical protein
LSTDRRLRVFIDALAGARPFTVSRAVATVGHIHRAQHQLQQLGYTITEIRMRPEVAEALELLPDPGDPGARLTPNGTRIHLSATVGECERSTSSCCTPRDVVAGAACGSCCAELVHTLRGRLMTRLPASRCHIDCPGWCCADVTATTGEVIACDACNRAQEILRRVTDAEVQLLPEALAKLLHLQRREVKRAATVREVAP